MRSSARSARILFVSGLFGYSLVAAVGGMCMAFWAALMEVQHLLDLVHKKGDICWFYLVRRHILFTELLMN